MFKLIVLAAALAVAAAAPGLLGGAVVGAPLPALGALGYTAGVVPAPYSYVSGHQVTYAVEPVEQHGYRIAF